MTSLPPAPPDPLLGRTREGETLARLLNDARHVDLLGPAGVGKSALALASAHDAAAEGRRVLWGPGARIPAGPCLVIVDAADGEAPDVNETLRRHPETQVLRVARQAPRSHSAARFELGPLDEEAGVALLTRLLARDVPGPREPAARGALTSIVRDLDGVPLALIYVAPFVARLGARAVAERAREAPFLLLAEAFAEAPPHHRSVAQLFQAPLARLAPEARTLLAELGVFGGAFAPADVDAVLGPGSAARTATLGALAQGGLLRVVREGLSTWALVRAALADEGPSDGVRARHAAFVLARGEADPELASVPELRRVATEESGDAAFRAAVLLGERAPGQVTDALASRLAPPAKVPAVWRARAARVRGRRALRRGEAAEACLELEAALEEAPPGLHAHVLCDLARADPEAARALHAKAIAGFRAVGDARGEARVLGHQATLDLEEGALRRAREGLRRAAKRARDAGDRRLEGQVRQNLGLALLEAESFTEAEAAFRAALALHEEAGDDRYRGIAALDRGLLRLAQGRPGAALRLLDPALGAAETHGDPESIALAWAARGEALAGLADRPAAERALRRAHSASGAFADAHHLVSISWGHVALLRARDHWAAAPDGGAYAEALADAEAHLARTAREVVREQGRLARARLARALATARSLHEVLLVSVDGRWFQPPAGSGVSLRRSPVLAAALRALAEARQDQGGASRSVLKRAIWPGERMSTASARNRLDVALSKLRQKGMGPCLTTDETGYALTGPLLRVPAR